MSAFRSPEEECEDLVMKMGGERPSSQDAIFIDDLIVLAVLSSGENVETRRIVHLPQSLSLTPSEMLSAELLVAVYQGFEANKHLLRRNTYLQVLQGAKAACHDLDISAAAFHALGNKRQRLFTK